MAVYCTWADVESKLSEAGADARIDDDSEAADGIIDEASAEIDLYLYRHYDPSAFAANRWVKHACAIIAVGVACARRGNPVPKSFVPRLERKYGDLEQIDAGRKHVPGLTRRRTSVPTLSQARILMGPSGPRTVISRHRGTRRSPPTDYRQPTDPLEPPVDGAFG